MRRRKVLTLKSIIVIGVCNRVILSCRIALEVGFSENNLWLTLDVKKIITIVAELLRALIETLISWVLTKQGCQVGLDEIWLTADQKWRWNCSLVPLILQLYIKTTYIVASSWYILIIFRAWSTDAESHHRKVNYFLKIIASETSHIRVHAVARIELN